MAHRPPILLQTSTSSAQQTLHLQPQIIWRVRMESIQEGAQVDEIYTGHYLARSSANHTSSFIYLTRRYVVSYVRVDSPSTLLILYAHGPSPITYTKGRVALVG